MLVLCDVCKNWICEKPWGDPVRLAGGYEPSLSKPTAYNYLIVGQKAVFSGKLSGVAGLSGRSAQCGLWRVDQREAASEHAHPDIQLAGGGALLHPVLGHEVLTDRTEWEEIRNSN